MPVNQWFDTLPPVGKHVIVWTGAGEDVARWTGVVWRSVTTGKVLFNIDWWREIDAPAQAQPEQVA